MNLKKIFAAQTVSEPVAQPAPAEKPKPVTKVGVMTGYVYEHPILNDDGLCEFTIDNKRNDMPVYVSIWDVEAQLPVRAFTVAQRRNQSEPTTCKLRE